MLGARYLGLALLGWTLCASSQAATMTYDFFAGPAPTVWKQSETFAPTGVAQPPVKAWGFWDDEAGIFVQGYIRQWQLGLGACGANELGTPANPGNCPGSGTHRAIDDIANARFFEEWVLLTFADPVAFDSVGLRTIPGEPGAGVVYWYGDDDGEFQNGLIGKSFIDIAAKADFSGSTTVNGTLAFDLGGGTGTFLLIGPDGTDGPTTTHPDAFYLNSLTVEEVAQQVPTPASGILFASVLAMMAGLRVRRPS